MSVTTAAEPGSRPRAAIAPKLVSDPAAQAVLALTVLAAVLRFVGLGHQGFWFDEGNTALLVHLSPGRMLGLIPQSESTPPLYYCLAWVWARVFGFGETGLRSLSAAAGVCVVPVAYAAARKLISDRAGVIAAALAACNPLLIWYSQEARSYELLVLLSGLSLLAFAYVAVDDQPGVRAVVAWVVASALALATHYYAFLVIVPEAAWLLYVHRRDRRVLIGLAVVAACGLALIPLALSQNGTGNANWIGKIALAPRMGQLLPQFLMGFGAPVHELLARLGEASVLVALGLLALRSASRRGPLVAGGLLAAGLVLNLLLVAGGVDDLITRNMMALWLPAALLVAGGLASPAALRSRPGILGAAVAATLCVVGVVAAVGVAGDRSLQRPDWRAAARALGPRPSAAGRMILIQEYRTLLPLSLYLKGLHFWRRQPFETVGEFDVIAVRAPRVKLCWWGAACNLTPSPAQPVYPIPGFVEVSRRRAYQFTVVRMLARHPVTLTRATVASALTATKLSHDGLIVQR